MKRQNQKRKNGSLWFNLNDWRSIERSFNLLNKLAVQVLEIISLKLISSLGDRGVKWFELIAKHHQMIGPTSQQIMEWKLVG